MDTHSHVHTLLVIAPQRNPVLRFLSQPTVLVGLVLLESGPESRDIALPEV